MSKKRLPAVTPDMIKAGEEVLMRAFENVQEAYFLPSMVVADAYTAMERARLSQENPALPARP